jgi:predicted nucleic acid-binding protein
MRRSTLTFEQARELQAEAEALLAGNEHEIDSGRVLEFVRDSDCSAYDCEFVALATHLNTKLVTMDAKLLKAFPKYAVSLAAG